MEKLVVVVEVDLITCHIRLDIEKKLLPLFNRRPKEGRIIRHIKLSALKFILFVLFLFLVNRLID